MCTISRNNFKRHYLKNKRLFVDFLLHFWNVDENLQHFKKKYEYPSPNYFRNYGLLKRWLLKRLKGLASEDHAVINVLTGSKHCWNQHGTTYYPIFPCIWDILSSKKSALVWSEILRLFVNTLTADNKYSRCNVHNFAQQLQTPLSQKQKTFCGFFIAFLKCGWNLEHLKKKDKYPSLIISEIMDC